MTAKSATLRHSHLGASPTPLPGWGSREPGTLAQTCPGGA